MAFSHVLNTVLRIIGPQATIRLAREYNGRSIKIPMEENLHDMHPIVVMVGLANAQALVREFREQGFLRLPMEVNTLLQIRNDAVVKQFLAGMTISSIATEFQIDRKLVQKIIDGAGHRDTRLSRSLTD